LDFDGIVAGWDIEEKEKIAKKERKYAASLSGVLKRIFNMKNVHQFRKHASNHQTRIKAIIKHQNNRIASNRRLMHNEPMRTTITLDDDVHEFASYYANAKGITLSAAMNELVRKAETAPAPKPEIVFSPDGFPMFPPIGGGRVITDEMVKKLEEEEFDPEKFA
jgi:hypothetical protein